MSFLNVRGLAGGLRLKWWSRFDLLSPLAGSIAYRLEIYGRHPRRIP